MANVDIYLGQIKASIYGKDARKPIHDLFSTLNSASEESLEIIEYMKNTLYFPVIKIQPLDTTVRPNEAAIFSIVASEADSYQWQYSSNGETWTDSPTGKSDVYSFTAVSGFNGRQYRCIVSNAYGTVESETVTLTVRR